MIIKYQDKALLVVMHSL